MGGPQRSPQTPRSRAMGGPLMSHHTPRLQLDGGSRGGWWLGGSAGGLDDVDDALDAFGALLEHGLLFVGQADLDDLLDALAADDDGDAHVEVLVAVLAVEVGRGGEEALLVEEV